MKLYPSIFAADPLNIAKALSDVSGADGLHLDVMDGHFVPNFGLSIDTINAIKKASKLPCLVHLMVNDPGLWMDKISFASGDTFVFHPEAMAQSHVIGILDQLDQKNIKKGFALSPGIPVSMIKPYVSRLDCVVVMGVEPGLSGQKMMPDTIDRVEEVSVMAKQEDFFVEVDGGVNVYNIKAVKEAGGHGCTVGSAIFAEKKPIIYLKKLQEACR